MATGTLTSAAAGNSLYAEKTDIYLSDGGSFSGTWQVQYQIGATWIPLATGTEADLPYQATGEASKSRQWRVEVTSFSAGTLNYVVD